MIPKWMRYEALMKIQYAALEAFDAGHSKLGIDNQRLGSQHDSPLRSAFGHRPSGKKMAGAPPVARCFFFGVSLTPMFPQLESPGLHAFMRHASAQRL